MNNARDQRSTESLIEDVFALQRRIIRALRGHFSGWADVDLTMAQLKTLVVLVDEGPCSIGQIASALNVSLPNASHLVDRLVRLDLAQRAEDAADRRRILASATQKGVDVLRNMRSGGQEQIREALSRVDPTDLHALIRGLDALVMTLEEIPAPSNQENDRESAAL
ncbi:MAG: MarR family transcriptional regulator [Nitrolancea sp.]